MGSVALEPASRWTHAELAEIFNAGYEGYFTPFSSTRRRSASCRRCWDDDLDALPGRARRRRAGRDLQARDPRRPRLDRAAIGVAVPHRGKGVGKALMRGVLDVARERGLRELWLEVLVQNEPAIRLYEKLGFERVRELEVWTLESVEAGSDTARPVPLEQAQTRIARERT